jgi:predicted CopG family antitoxin
MYKEINMETKSVKVDKDVWKELSKMRIDLELKTISDVVKYLVKEYKND